MVEYLACADCENSYWIPDSPCGEPILIDQYYNPVTVATAGRYRVLSLGERSKTSGATQSMRNDMAIEFATFTITQNQVRYSQRFCMFQGEAYRESEKPVHHVTAKKTAGNSICLEAIEHIITAQNNPIRLDIPGTYRVVPDGMHNCNSMVCYDIYGTCCGG